MGEVPDEVRVCMCKCLFSHSLLPRPISPFRFYTTPKWDKFGDDAEKKIEEGEKTETAASDATLGIDAAAPKSAQQKKDMEKHEALKIAKQQWEGRKQAEAAACYDIADDKGVERTIADADLGMKRVLTFKGCEGSTYVIPAETKLIKIFIDDCKDCVFLVGCKLVSHHRNTHTPYTHTPYAHIVHAPYARRTHTMYAHIVHPHTLYSSYIYTELHALYSSYIHTELHALYSS